MLKSATAWQQIRIPHFPKLATKASCDVLVVGGGITGLTAAYLLLRAGKKVCLLERDRLGQGDTGCTTAHLTAVTDLRIPKLVSRFGREQAQLVFQGGATAINAIEEIADNEGIECEFRRVPGFLHAPMDSDERQAKQLRREAAQAAELGIPASFVESVPIVNCPGISFANQAKFHPLKYLAGLAQAIVKGGGAIHEQSEVTEFVETPLGAKVNGATVHCDFIVIATHVPLMGLTGSVSAALFQAKLAPYSSYAIGAKLPKAKFPEASFWDTSDPYYYLRIDRHQRHDYAVLGGEDHKTGQETKTEERFEALRKILADLIPEAQADRQWSGQVIETNDGLPYIGETAERQFVATGFAGNGMTFGTLAAIMARDAALGRENRWQRLFSANRKQLRGGTWRWVKENLDYPYYLVRDSIKKPEARRPSDVKEGEGKVLKVDGKWVACSRDEAGKVQTVSAVCTHLGCLVHWNSAEKTWDCPCHGSRFDPTGQVRAGPSETALEQATVGPVKSAGQTEKRPRRHSGAAKRGRSKAARQSSRT